MCIRFKITLDRTNQDATENLGSYVFFNILIVPYYMQEKASATTGFRNGNGNSVIENAINTRRV